MYNIVYNYSYFASLLILTEGAESQRLGPLGAGTPDSAGPGGSPVAIMAVKREKLSDGLANFRPIAMTSSTPARCQELRTFILHQTRAYPRYFMLFSIGSLQCQVVYQHFLCDKHGAPNIGVNKS